MKNALSPNLKTEEYYRGEDLVVPTRSKYTTVYLYSKGKLVYTFEGENAEKDARDVTGDGSRAANAKSSVNYVREVCLDTEAYQAARRAYNEEVARRRAEFAEGLCKDEGLDPNSTKVVRMFELAWNYGHSHGFSSVRDYFYDMADLVR